MSGHRASISVRQFATCLAKLHLVPEVRLPNQAWVEFMSGPLTVEDWILIGCVERGEISVDAAMAGRRL